MLLLTVPVLAQTCMSAADMEPSVRTALETAAKRFFDMSARGDAATLKQNSVSSLAASFAGVESALKDNQPAFSGASASRSSAIFC